MVALLQQLNPEAIDPYIQDYISRLGYPERTAAHLVRKSRLIARRRIGALGNPTYLDLHRVLEQILDFHQIDASRTVHQDAHGDVVSYDNLTAKDLDWLLNQDAIKHAQTSDSRGELHIAHELIDSLRIKLPINQFSALVDLLGGIDALVDHVASTNLTASDVGQLNECDIAWLKSTSFEQRQHCLDYERYLRGDLLTNPIHRLTPDTVPLVRRVIADLFARHGDVTKEQLCRLGFKSLLVEAGGIAEIVRMTNSELLHKITGLHIWQHKQDSVPLGVKAIEEVLYSLPGYKKAEKTSNRQQQVVIINNFLKTEQAQRGYFMSRIPNVMCYLVDPEGINGLAKPGSVKALLEFYSRQKGLDWFNRQRECYVQAWRITEKGMWQRAEASVQLAMQAIEDVLYQIPGYRAAELSHDTNAQLIALDRFIQQLNGSSLVEYFKDEGMSGLLGSFYDPSGNCGLRKKHSAYALLEFYSTRKSLGWFDTSQERYISQNKRKQPIVVCRTVLYA